MFQLLIRDKQYWEDDSRLILLPELIAVEHSVVWTKWTTCWMTSCLFTEWDMKSWTQYETCYDHKNSQLVLPISQPWLLRWQCIHTVINVTFFHFIIINRISLGHRERAWEASRSQDGCNLTLMYSKNGSPRSPSLCSGEREVVCERV